MRIFPPASSLIDALVTLGLAHRLSWCEVDRLLELAEADAGGGAPARADLEAQLAAARVASIYQSLGQYDLGLVPLSELGQGAA